MNNSKRDKKVRVSLKRKRGKKREKERPWYGGGHPYYCCDIP